MAPAIRAVFISGAFSGKPLAERRAHIRLAAKLADEVKPRRKRGKIFR